MRYRFFFEVIGRTWSNRDIVLCEWNPNAPFIYPPNFIVPVNSNLELILKVCLSLKKCLNLKHSILRQGLKKPSGKKCHLGVEDPYRIFCRKQRYHNLASINLENGVRKGEKRRGSSKPWHRKRGQLGVKTYRFTRSREDCRAKCGDKERAHCSGPGVASRKENRPWEDEDAALPSSRDGPWARNKGLWEWKVNNSNNVHYL